MHPRHARTVIAAALALAALAPLAGRAGAQPGAAPAPALDARGRAEILDSLQAQILRNYVEGDTARMIVERLKKQRKAGAYDQVTDVREFSEKVTNDLRSLNNDLHLSLRYDPDAAASGPDARMGARRVVVAGGPGGGPGAPRDTAVGNARMMPGMRDAEQRNFGLSKVEILPGNIGYLKVSMFLGAPGVEAVMADALRFLERTDAVIIDVRDNPGGSGVMSHLLFSHFLGAEPVRTIDVKSRIPGLSREQSSVAEVPGPRRPDVPLYVLTSRGTGSAAEEFSFVLSNLKRATLVGEATAGAGHMVNGFALPRGFVAGVSITRVSDPRTGREWERIGVQPDVRVPAASALDVAQAAALRRIGGTASEPRRSALAMQAEYLEARARREPVPAPRRDAIVGRYEGDRSITLEDGQLVYRRGEAMRSEMVPLTDGRFSLSGEARLEFSGDSPASTLTIERADGSRQVLKRVNGGD